MTNSAAGRALRRYLPFATSRLHGLLQYRSALLMTALAAAVGAGVQVFLWRAVAASAPGGRAGGYDAGELTTYVLAAHGLFLLHANRVDEEMGSDIYTGSIATLVVRPVRYPLMRFVSALPVIAVNGVFLTLPVVAVFAVATSLAVPSATNLALFSIAVVFSVVLGFAINLLIGMAGFLTTNSWGLRNAKESVVAFFSGQLVPLALMPAPLAALCTALPFQGMAHLPLRLLLGRYDGPAEAGEILLSQAGWAAGMLVLAALLWRRALHRLEVFGG